MNLLLRPTRPLLAALALAACAPALDWHEMQPAGLGPLTLSLPCRPDGHARRLPLAGAEVELSLHACQAGGHTYAVASADLADPGRVPAALAELAAAARANVQGRVEAEAAAHVPGMTPQAAARRWRLAGTLPDGQAVIEQVQVFAYGPRIYQATMVGARGDEVRAQLFFGGLRLRP